MSKGISATLTYVVAAVIMLVAALTLILGGTGFISSLFDHSQSSISEQGCQLKLQQVRQGNLPPSELPDQCRAMFSEKTWEQAQRQYEKEKLADILTGS